ncbi:MAG: PAS domain-containing sensor histidine kinase [Methanomicrobiales archaeon]|nr:PAS domain-containing sensor histidine kinase [Methanomicrobiales archaeon]
MTESKERRLLWLLLTAASTSITVVITIISLSMGIHEIFPFLYLFPVIMVAYRYPEHGVEFSLFLGSLYIALVYLFGLSDIVFLSIGTAWFYVVVSVGVVMSSLSQGMRREEGRYKSIFNSSQAGIFVLDKGAMKVLEVNGMCARTLGYKPRELAGTPLSTIWPDQEQSANLLGRINTLFCLVDTDVKLRDRHGSIREVLLSASPVDEKRIVCSFIDITERKAIEEALFDSEIKFRNIVEKSLAGVYMIQDDRFVYVNPTFARIHGHTVSSLMSTIHPRDLVFDMDQERMAELERQYRVEGLGPFHYEVRHIRADGEVISVEVRESIVEYHGKPAIMGTALDVTETRKNRNALKSANEKLNLLSSITRHDLLNQITAVMGFVDLATEDGDHEQVHSYLGKASSVIQRMYKLLQFTRDYQNLGLHTPEWMDVQQTFTRAASMLSVPDLTIVVLTGNLQLYADPLLEKVFYNLIENSIRHGGHVTRIELRYEEIPDGLLLVYSDDGMGVTPENKDAIFKRAYGSNHGYGLFLCQQILTLTDMRIVENGEQGRGARFEISIPKGNFRFAEIGIEHRAPKTVLEAGI